MKPCVWILIPFKEDFVAELGGRYRVEHTPSGPKEPALAQMKGEAVRAVITNGTTGFTDAQMAALPDLQIVAVFGAGYENVDVAAAKRRGIAVTYAPHMNDATVADHALGLMLAVSRGFVVVDKGVREGRWTTSRAERPTISGKRLGLLGLGNIGLGIAKRAEGFEMTVAYHTRSARPDVPWRHVPKLVDLARESDYLVVACPGGAATKHLVNADVLKALGPQGFLVNIARGSVVDTAALVRALKEKTIAGAGLDVLEGEPEIPAGLLGMENVVFTPHMAGRSPEVLRAQMDLLLGNLEARFAGRPMLSPVP